MWSIFITPRSGTGKLLFEAAKTTVSPPCQSRFYYPYGNLANKQARLLQQGQIAGS
jgi:hypothetical protein